MAFSDAAADDPFSTSGGQSAFDVKTALLTLRKYYWILILTGGIGVALAFVYLKTVQPIYRSMAEIKVERRSATQSVSVGGGSSGESTAPEDLKTIEQSFISPMLMGRVVKVLDLAKHDGFIGKGRSAASVSEGELVGYLLGHSKVALVPDTRLIQISFENWNPEMTQKVTNAIVEQGIEFDKEQRITALGANVTYLQEEVRKLESNLRSSEEKLNSYTQQLGNVSIDNELNITADKLRELNTRSTVVRAERMKLESDYEQIQMTLDDPEKLLLVESIRKVPAVESLYTKVNELKNQVAKLEQRYGPDMPVMIQTKTELQQVEKALKAEVLQAPKSVEVALAAARRNEASSLQEQADQEKEVIKLRELAVPAKVLQRQIEADKLTYEAALKRLNEELSEVRSQPVLLQLAKPAGPAIKANTSSIKVLATAAMAGLMVGAGIIFLLMQLDSSIKSVEDAEAALKLAVLANVPRYTSERPEDKGPFAREDASDQKAAGKGLAARIAQTTGLRKKYGEVAGRGELAIPDLAHSPLVKDEYSMAAESFRTLRASIQMIEEAGKGNLILITSPLPAEGKSFCSLNLAVALAQSGLRTLLVDAQLRTPVLEERIFSSRGHRGLTDFLLGSTIFSSVIRASPIANLDVVTAGSASPHPAEILSRTRLREFLDEAQQHYDRIVFDSASITPVSDTLCFARFFPVICLVLRAGRTSRRAAERSLELLARSGAKPFGLVMNFAAQQSHGEYGMTRSPEHSTFILDFPKTCSSCGKVYEDFEDYLKQTLPPADDAVPVEARHSVQIFRVCQCGHMVVVPSSNRRDFSAMGERQREIFGELLDQLVNAGLPREEARARLLLTLKIWRSEIYSDSARDTTSKAGQRRHQLFSELLDQLVKGGLQREDAQAKMLLAIKIWHDAP